jgi:hypothetical protein
MVIENGRRGGMGNAVGDVSRSLWYITIPFSLSTLILNRNTAREGEHLFSTCNRLLTTVTSPKYDWCGDVSEKLTSLMGVYSSPFLSPLSLFIFLVGYSGSVVYVRSVWDLTEKYYWVEESPCLTLERRIAKLESGVGQRRMYV